MIEVMKGLTEEQTAEIHQASLEVLESVGVQVSHPELQRQCRAAGALVEEGNARIRFPAQLVEEMLALVPHEYLIADVEGNIRSVGGEHQYGLGIVTDPFIIDYESQQPRRPRLEDIRKHTTFGQRCDFIGGMSRMDFPVTDVEGPHSSLRALEEFFHYQNKHIHAYVTSVESLRQYFEIGEILLQGKSLSGSRLMSVAVAPFTPLGLSDLNADLLLMACAHGFTVIPTICPMAGTTSPYSIASTLLLGNIENLFLIVLSQMINPGNPFLYTFGPSISDMRSGYDKYYTLDKVLWKIGASHMAQRYRVPFAAECGGAMTYRYDQQNGAEGMLFMLAAQALKANVLAGFGSTYNAMGMSGEMQMIHLSWLHAARFLQRGIQFDSGKLGVESIKAVGPGGTFLMDELTLDLLRADEFFADELFDLSGGFAESTPLLQRAHDTFESFVADPQSPLSEKTQADLHAYFAQQHD